MEFSRLCDRYCGFVFVLFFPFFVGEGGGSVSASCQVIFILSHFINDFATFQPKQVPQLRYRGNEKAKRDHTHAAQNIC